jgi:hypothetical protein
MRWNATPKDIKWVTKLVDSLNDGGSWVCSAGVYVINKQTKTLTLTVPYPDEVSKELHERNKIVFPAIGYTVTELEKGQENKE